MVFAILGPMLLFGSKLEAAQARPQTYSTLASVPCASSMASGSAGAPTNAPLIGSVDIQSLADLGNSQPAIT